MILPNGTIHSKFKLNGVAYGSSNLSELAYDLVKEGSSFEQSIGNFLSDWLDENSTVTVQTSGSTGAPKKIELQKQHMVNSALATGEFFDLKEGDTSLLCLPVDYIAGKMMLVRAMVLGLELDYVEPSSNPLEELSKSYDFAAMIPLQLKSSLGEIENIKTLIVGGAAVSQTLREKAQKKSVAIFETYGMTETITHVAVKSINAKTKLRQNYFKALSKVSFSVNERECLVIDAPRVSDSLVVTNDMVKLISETEFEWLGRYDNVINSGGVKLFPEQIEAKLSPLISNRFFVAGIPDQILGEKLILIVEGEIDVEKLTALLKAENYFEKFEIPKALYSIPNFVITETGKIHRKENLKKI